jgi:hypothetical protein
MLLRFGNEVLADVAAPQQWPARLAQVTERGAKKRGAIAAAISGDNFVMDSEHKHG